MAMDLCIDEKDEERESEAQSVVRAKKHLAFHVLRCKLSLCTKTVVFVYDPAGRFFLKMDNLSFLFLTLPGSFF